MKAENIILKRNSRTKGTIIHLSKEDLDCLTDKDSVKVNITFEVVE